MKENKTKHTILFKKTIIALCILSGIEILIMIIFGLYDLLFITPKQTHSKSFAVSTEDIKSDIESISTPASLAELEILPTDYDTLKKDLGALSSHELTTYLRYSEVLKSKDTANLTNGYQYLIDSNLGIFIPQSYIDQYLLTKISDISTLMLKDSGNADVTLRYLEIDPNSIVKTELTQCIAQNLDTFLDGSTCQDLLGKIHNEELLPTLTFLTTSLKFSSLSSSNEYDQYVHNQMYLYQIEKVNSSVASTENTKTYTNDTYLDLDKSHIHRLQLLVNYLKALNTQLGYFSSTTTTQIQTLDTIVTALAQYKYGNDIPSEIKALVNNQLINMDTSQTTYATINPEISILIKSLNIDGDIKTFVAPMYTFSSKTDTPVSSLTFEINDNNFNEAYDVKLSTQASGTVRVPIFMYHQITQVPAGQNRFKSGLYVDPQDFEKQMAYLVKKNYKTISTLQYSQLLATGKNPTQKTAMITFDDGVENQYTNAYPILKKYGLIGVFYIISQRSSITQAQTKEMSDNGMDIGSHSAHHPDLTKVTSPDTLSAEIVSSKYALQSATGKTVYSFAYPGCGYNATTLSYVSSAGYAIAVSCGSTIDNYPGHKLTLSRVHAFGDMESFKNLLSGQLWSY